MVPTPLFSRALGSVTTLPLSDMLRAVTYRQVVREIALDNYGYVTTKDAAEAGVPAVELPKLATRPPARAGGRRGDCGK